MPELSEFTDDQLFAELARRAQERTKGCTWVAASWCPVHGSCTCPEDEELSANGYRKSMNDEDCPLHSSRSEHATVRGPTGTVFIGTEP